MNILHLYRYPVKSLPGIDVQQVRYDSHGLLDDREFILLDNRNKMVTLRTDPRLYELRIRDMGGTFEIEHKEHTVTLDKDSFSTEAMELSVWKRRVKGALAPEHVNAFFSDVLGQEISCFRFIPQEPDEAGFRDSKPLLVINLASVRALEEKLNATLDPLRFRPNVILDTDVPFSETGWKKLELGSQQFSVVKPCARCIVINIDPETGLAGPNVLAQLLPYNTIPNKVFFGQYVKPVAHAGELRTGTPAVIQSVY